MRGGLQLSNNLRASGFLGALEHVDARELRGAVQQCSGPCADAAARDIGSQAAKLVAGPAFVMLAVDNTLEIGGRRSFSAVHPCKRDPGGVAVFISVSASAPSRPL